jgi:hypothetical protein
MVAPQLAEVTTLPSFDFLVETAKIQDIEVSFGYLKIISKLTVWTKIKPLREEPEAQGCFKLEPQERRFPVKLKGQHR